MTRTLTDVELEALLERAVSRVSHRRRGPEAAAVTARALTEAEIREIVRDELRARRRPRKPAPPKAPTREDREAMARRLRRMGLSE